MTKIVYFMWLNRPFILFEKGSFNNDVWLLLPFILVFILININ